MTASQSPAPTRLIRRSVRLTGVLAATLFLAAVPTPADACTPAPCITASPNPVGVVVPQTQGTTVLEWNAGATLTPPTIVVEAPGVPVATYPVAAQGTQQITVQVSKTYTARLVLKDRAGEKLLASVQIPVKPKLNIPGPEQTGTVKNVKVIPRGTWVELQFTAPFPSKAAVWISKNPPQGNSEQGLQVVRYAPAVGGNQIQHTKKLYDIAPSTLYHYLIRTTSENGLRAHATGSFWTKRRVATIRVSKIKVIDDSDELSAGDLSFAAFINPQYSAPYDRDDQDFFPSNAAQTVEVDSGEFLSTPGFQVALDGAGDELDFNITGSDEDSSTCGKFPVARNGVLSNDCGDFSGKTMTHPLTPDGPGQEEYTRSFQLTAGDAPGGKLKFRAYCTLQVSYVAPKILPILPR